MASPTPSGEVASKISRCLPGIWSSHSSFASRVGCHGASADAGAGVLAPPCWAAAAEEPNPKAAAAAPRRARNDRRAVIPSSFQARDSSVLFVSPLEVVNFPALEVPDAGADLVHQ